MKAGTFWLLASCAMRAIKQIEWLLQLLSMGSRAGRLRFHETIAGRGVLRKIVIVSYGGRGTVVAVARQENSLMTKRQRGIPRGLSHRLLLRRLLLVGVVGYLVAFSVLVHERWGVTDKTTSLPSTVGVQMHDRCTAIGLEIPMFFAVPRNGSRG